jgi:hypothetical protein
MEGDSVTHGCCTCSCDRLWRRASISSNADERQVPTNIPVVFPATYQHTSTLVFVCSTEVGVGRISEIGGEENRAYIIESRV